MPGWDGRAFLGFSAPLIHEGIAMMKNLRTRRHMAAAAGVAAVAAVALVWTRHLPCPRHHRQRWPRRVLERSAARAAGGRRRRFLAFPISRTRTGLHGLVRCRVRRRATAARPGATRPFWRGDHGHHVVRGEPGNGRWGQPVTVPGVTSLNRGDSNVYVGVVHAGRVRGRGVLHRRRPAPAGVRHRPAAGPVAARGRGARPGRAERRR